MAHMKAWLTDYPDEVLSWMHQREEEHLPYHGNSPQLSNRSQLVEFLCSVTERLKLSVGTTHLSVYLLDRFMDAHHINDTQLQLTALTAILLAAKFEEKDINVPRIPDLNTYTDDRYSISIFNSMEILMLKFFNWNIGTVTVAHFAELYLTQGVTFDDTMNGTPVTSPSHARRSLWAFTGHFMDISLHDQAFLQWSSSQIGAACVACGRLFLHIYPVWNPDLQKFTGYDLKALSPVMDMLLRLHESEEQVACGTPDSGYTSHCSSNAGSP